VGSGKLRRSRRLRRWRLPRILWRRARSCSGRAPCCRVQPRLKTGYVTRLVTRRTPHLDADDFAVILARLPDTPPVAFMQKLRSFLIAVLLITVVPQAGRAADVQTMEDLVVTGERAGPGMWHVYKDSEHLWILGSLSPLPKGITWRANEVQRRLESIRQVLVPKPLEIGIVHILWLLVTEHKVFMLSGGKRLKDVMAPDLYARFAQQRAKYGNDASKWEHFRPIIAAALLQQEAFRQAGLSARIDLGAAVRKLAHDRHIPLDEVKVAGVGDLMDTLKVMPQSTESTCVAASLTTIESDLPRLKERAAAWASGNVERLESLPEPAAVDDCVAALDAGAARGDLFARIRHAWREALESALHSGKPTLAVANIDMLIEKGGLLDQLRAQGYQVEAPPGAKR